MLAHFVFESARIVCRLPSPPLLPGLGREGVTAVDSRGDAERHGTAGTQGLRAIWCAPSATKVSCVLRLRVPYTPPVHRPATFRGSGPFSLRLRLYRSRLRGASTVHHGQRDAAIGHRNDPALAQLDAELLDRLAPRLPACRPVEVEGVCRARVRDALEDVLRCAAIQAERDERATGVVVAPLPEAGGRPCRSATPPARRPPTLRSAHLARSVESCISVPAFSTRPAWTCDTPSAWLWAKSRIPVRAQTVIKLVHPLSSTALVHVGLSRSRRSVARGARARNDAAPAPSMPA